MAEATAPHVLAPALPFWQIRFFCLVCAIVIYALAGVPTPERFGVAEALTGILLATSIGVPGAAQAFEEGAAPRWERAGRWLLFYGLSVPVVTGLVYGNAPVDIMRDLVPFLFLLLPLFLFPSLAGRKRPIRQLTAAICLLGVLFAVRVLLPYLQGDPDILDPHRLANAPTVLFSALFMTGVSGLLLYQGETAKSAALFLLSLVPLAAMAMITQRASIGIYALTLAILLGTGIVRRPLRMGLPLGLIALAVTAYWPIIADIAEQLWRKQEAVGLNMRWQEAVAVMDAMGGSMPAVLFGKGWGSTVASPAVGGDVVTFTHSIITTYFLKTGLAGLVLLAVYLLRMGFMLLPMIESRPVIAFALGGPFAIDVLLYASFKSLDFGLILLLIPLWASLPIAKK